MRRDEHGCICTRAGAGGERVKTIEQRIERLERDSPGWSLWPLLAIAVVLAFVLFSTRMEVRVSRDELCRLVDYALPWEDQQYDVYKCVAVTSQATGKEVFADAR
jgi:hypothetical protein